MGKQSTLRLITRAAEFLSIAELRRLHAPGDMRGIYVLYRQQLDRYDVVYVGMGNIRFRLRSHLKKKVDKKNENLFTHGSIFEVFDNITNAELEELEGLFRHLYRFDSRPTLNRQRSYNKLKQLPQIFPSIRQRWKPPFAETDASPKRGVRAAPKSASRAQI